MTREGPLKVARTFIENRPECFGIYTKRRPGGPSNGDLLALCGSEDDAKLFAASPTLLKTLRSVLQSLRSVQKHIDNEYALGFITEAEEEAVDTIRDLTGETY